MANFDTTSKRSASVDDTSATGQDLPVSETDCRILAFLEETSGYLTRQVAETTGATGRASSAAIGRDLRRMASQGLVGTLDSDKPVCWTRTPAGTQMLERARACGLIGEDER